MGGGMGMYGGGHPGLRLLVFLIFVALNYLIIYWVVAAAVRKVLQERDGILRPTAQQPPLMPPPK
jgi:hypothetical protein